MASTLSNTTQTVNKSQSSSSSMKSQMKLSLILVALVALGCQAMPQRRRLTVASQRQVEYSSTPYPAAGFRPRIPFDLPKPKLETEPVTQSITTTPEEEEEEQEQTLATTENLVLDKSLRTPANTYGAPSAADEVEDTVEIEAAPARDFQPPVLEAVDDFAANGLAGEQQPVADVPALGKELKEEPQTQSEIETETETESDTEEVDLKVAITTPANTYGPPLPTAAAAGTPATTYGAPELDEPTTNELDDVEESQVELVEEVEQEQEITNELASGRLILLPLGPGGAQFGRLILAVEQPRQRQKSLRSERLRRI